MKKIILALVFLSIVLPNIFGKDIRESNVPKIVKDVLYKAYPKAEYVEWEYKRDYKCYEAEFKIGRLEHEMKISDIGKLIYLKRDINLQDIPKPISEYINKEYSNAKYLGAEFISIDGTEEYKVRIYYRNSSNNRRHTNLYFTKEGVLLH